MNDITIRKVFISVGMRGRKWGDICYDIEVAKKSVKSMIGAGVEIEFVENLITPPEGAERLHCLGEAIKKLGECDACYFCPGWKAYSGCCVEHYICEQYGIIMIERS